MPPLSTASRRPYPRDGCSQIWNNGTFYAEWYLQLPRSCLIEKHWQILKKYFRCPCVSQISANFISFYLIGPNLISRSVIGWILFGLLRSWRLQWVFCLLFDSKESWTEHERLDYYRCPPSVCSVGDGGDGQDVEVPPPHPGYHCVRAWNVFIIV